MGTTRKWLVIVGGAITLSLALVSTAGAVTDQRLTPDYTNCTPPDYPSGCAKDIGVVGKEFPPNTRVRFSWLEPQLFLAGAGGPGATVQQVTGTVCGNLLLAKPLTPSPASVITDSTGGFVATINGPPPGPAVYGPNAICAFWVDGSGTLRGVGNQYTIYPA